MYTEKRKYYKLLIFMLALSLHGCNSNSQNLSQVELIKDLKILNTAITTVHPITLNKAWSNNLDSFIFKVESRHMSGLTAYEYENIIREALTIVGCAHTKIKESPLANIYLNQIGEKKYLPIRCFADSSGLYLIDVELGANNQQMNFPLKIISINNMAASEIVNKLIVYQPVDGHHKTMGYSIINDYSDVLIRRCFIGSDDFKIIYENTDGEKDELKLEAVKEYSPNRFEHFQPESNFLIREEFISLSQLNQNTAYLRIKSMDYKNFKSMNMQIFNKINDKKFETLVIDLRGNGGGTPKSTLDFLSYILDDTLSQTDIRPTGNASKFLSSKLKLVGVWLWEKTTRHYKTESGTHYITRLTYPKLEQYKGRIFILTDGYTASSACTMASYLKYKAGAISIGQETAGGETGCNANSFQTLTLPFSKITINFPLFRFNNDIPLSDNHHGIRPNQNIKYNAKTYMQNTDLEMERIFNLID